MKTIVQVVVLCASAALLTLGCARQTQTVKLYHDVASIAKPYERLLVIDIASDSNRQQMFEDRIVAELRSERVEAVASHPTLDASNGLLQSEIRSLGVDVDADAILVTHIAALDTRVDIEKGRENLVSTCRGGDPVDYFLYDHEVLKEPDAVALAHTMMVVSNLYDTTTHDRVWSIQSTCFDKKSMPEVLAAESHAIVRQLKIDKLIQ